MENSTQRPLIGNAHILLIRVGKSIWHKISGAELNGVLLLSIQEIVVIPLVKETMALYQ